MDLTADVSLVSPVEMRTTMARFATGVVVLTVGGKHIHAMTANAFSSVSLDPPLVLCCVSSAAVMHGAITAAGHFATSVLHAGQEAHARHFADRARPLGRAQFEVGEWLPSPRTGAPRLADCLAWVECVLTDAHAAGDHSIFIGRVVSTGLGTGEGGLLFFDGGFRQVASTP